MKYFGTLIAALVFLGIPAPTCAGIDVTPDPRDPSIVVEVETGASGQPPGSGGPASPPSTPISPPVEAVCEPGAAGEVQCFPRTPDDPPAADRPKPTEADVLRATRTIGLPSLKVNVQPADKTLVNVPTVLYTEPQPFERSVTLLTYNVDLTAKPISYQWIHGDGTDQQTTSPGGRYPSMDVTHRYQHPKKNARVQVNVTYEVRYRIDGDPWKTIEQHLTATGPAVQLDVGEAAPMLTKP